jgi:hypothetical protein
MADKLALEEVFYLLLVIRSGVIPPFQQTHLFVCHRRCVTLTTDSVAK